MKLIDKDTSMIEKIILSILVVSVLFILFLSCKTNREKMYSTHVDSVYVQRLIPISLPADSAIVKALLRCNSEGLVTLARLNIETTKNANLRLKLDSLGELRVQTIVKRDTVWVKTDSVSVKGVVTNFKFVEKPLTKWQRFKIEAGGWLIGAISGLIVLFVLYLVIKR